MLLTLLKTTTQSCAFFSTNLHNVIKAANCYSAALNVICTAQNYNAIVCYFLFSSTQAYIYLQDNGSDNQCPTPKWWNFTSHVLIPCFIPNITFYLICQRKNRLIFATDHCWYQCGYSVYLVSGVGNPRFTIDRGYRTKIRYEYISNCWQPFSGNLQMTTLSSL